MLSLRLLPEMILMEHWSFLRTVQQYLVAVGLSVSPDRKEMMRFTDPIMQSGEVLVQRKPNGRYKMLAEDIGQKMVRNLLDLKGKTVYVQKVLHTPRGLHAPCSGSQALTLASSRCHMMPKSLRIRSHAVR